VRPLAAKVSFADIQRPTPLSPISAAAAVSEFDQNKSRQGAEYQ
jgi:hypothetical protein